MKTASTLLQILALGACFAIHVSAGESIQMPGVRRAIQTIAGAGGQNTAPDYVYTTDAIGDL